MSDFISHKGERLALAVSLVEADRQGLHMVINLQAQVSEHPRGGLARNPGDGEIEQCDHQQQAKQQGNEPVLIHGFG